VRASRSRQLLSTYFRKWGDVMAMSPATRLRWSRSLFSDTASQTKAIKDVIYRAAERDGRLSAFLRRHSAAVDAMIAARLRQDNSEALGLYHALGPAEAQREAVAYALSQPDNTRALAAADGIRAALLAVRYPRDVSGWYWRQGFDNHEFAWAVADAPDSPKAVEWFLRDLYRRGVEWGRAEKRSPYLASNYGRNVFASDTAQQLMQPKIKGLILQAMEQGIKGVAAFKKALEKAPDKIIGYAMESASDVLREVQKDYAGSPPPDYVETPWVDELIILIDYTQRAYKALTGQAFDSLPDAIACQNLIATRLNKMNEDLRAEQDSYRKKALAFDLLHKTEAAVAILSAATRTGITKTKRSDPYETAFYEFLRSKLMPDFIEADTWLRDQYELLPAAGLTRWPEEMEAARVRLDRDLRADAAYLRNQARRGTPD
jgi:hypothetical protein